MADGLTPSLALAALVSGGLCMLIAVRYVPLLAALSIAVVRIAIPVIYFAWFYDGRWTFLDDLTYWRQGHTMLAAGYGPIEALFSADGLVRYFSLAQGVHILYIWWCHLAQYLFGPYYFAPVFLNVVVTFAAGAALFHLARVAGLGARYATGLFAVFLLHWDVLIWSSLINLKDILVLALALTGLLCCALIAARSISRRQRILAWSGLIGVMLLLPWLRFYLPVLLLMTVAGWALLKVGGRRRLFMVVGAATIAMWIASRYTVPAGLLALSPTALVHGSIRFVLTPQPWSIEAAYSFLTFPAIMHWLFVLPALAGAVLLWRSSSVGSLVVIYLLVNTLFFAVVPELQGPRQRIQASFVLIWAQYHAVFTALAWVAARRGAGRLRSELGSSTPMPVSA